MGKKTNAAKGVLKRIKASTVRKLLSVSCKLNPGSKSNMLYGFVELDGTVGEWGVMFDYYLNAWYGSLDRDDKVIRMEDPKEVAYITIRNYYEKNGVAVIDD